MTRSSLPLVCALSIAGALTTSAPVDACSVVSYAAKSSSTQLGGAGHAGFETHALVAQGFDWPVGRGLVYINPRGLQKKALLASPDLRAAEWVSRYGSVSFSPTAREFSVGGINEVGLTVSVLQAPNSDPLVSAGTGPAINELQFPQFLLDTVATVADAVAATKDLRLAALYSTLHYMACDVKGECAVFEFSEQGQTVHSQLTVAAFTNSTYEESIAAYTAYASAAKPRLPGDDSLQRFVRLAVLSKNAPTWGDPIAYAYYILSAVYAPDFTKWNIVYDRRQGLAGSTFDVSWRTEGAPNAKSISLAKLDFACSAPRQLLDMDLAQSGDVTRAFVPETATKIHEVNAQNVDAGEDVAAQVEACAAASTRCSGN